MDNVPNSFLFYDLLLIYSGISFVTNLFTLFIFVVLIPMLEANPKRKEKNILQNVM